MRLSLATLLARWSTAPIGSARLTLLILLTVVLATYTANGLSTWAQTLAIFARYDAAGRASQDRWAAREAEDRRFREVIGRRIGLTAAESAYVRQGR